MTMREDVAVVTFASGDYTQMPYSRVRPGLSHHNPDIPLFIFHNETDIGSPPHSRDPYAFKLYAIERVRKMGFRTVLWCDSILKLQRDLNPLIAEVRNVGVYLAGDGLKCGQWANDRALDYFGVTRDQAMEISAIWACFMGFDFQSPVASEFIRRWKAACNAGAFRGRWNNNELTESQDPRCKGHRHDQSCAELVAHAMKLPLSRPVLHPDPTYDHTYFEGRGW